MRIALVGTRGVPARYGGFETCVEEVGRRLVDAGHEVIVYCRRSGEEESPRRHLGMELVHLPAARRRSLETLSHTFVSVLHLLRHRSDVAIVFNAANAPFLPLLRLARIPVATHVDGLEWQRAKWGRAGRAYYRRAEQLAVRWSDALVADARGIAEYYRDTFAAATEQIAYGAPRVERRAGHRLGELGLEPGGYHLVVARFEPENHVLEIMRGHAAAEVRLPLVAVGSAPYADSYIEAVGAAAGPSTRLVGGVWDQELLDDLYANAATYLHGHSVGGTNPSLLRAAGAGAPTIAYDVVFNREVLGDAGRYFVDVDDVARHLEAAEQDPGATATRGEQARERAAAYDWDDVAAAYEQMCADLHGGRLRRGPGSTGRRLR